MLRRRGTLADRERAARLLEAARKTSDRLGMPGLAVTIEALADDGAAPRPSAPAKLPPKSVAPSTLVPSAQFELRPEGEYWTVTCTDAVFRLKDSRGLRILALRARVNVRKRVLDAIVKIGEHNAPLAQHLEWAVKTGTFCAYHPSGRTRAR
jgi:hypothetical protein